jgi:hypothetical protein
LLLGALNKSDFGTINSNVGVQCVWPDSGARVYLIHLPSKRMEIVRASDSIFSTNFKDSDTTILFVDAPGKHSAAWSIFGTSQPVGLRPRKSRANPYFTQTRDIFGRPVSKSGSTQIRIETAPSQGSRSRVSW